MSLRKKVPTPFLCWECKKKNIFVLMSVRERPFLGEEAYRTQDFTPNCCATWSALSKVQAVHVLEDEAISRTQELQKSPTSMNALTSILFATEHGSTSMWPLLLPVWFSLSLVCSCGCQGRWDIPSHLSNPTVSGWWHHYLVGVEWCTSEWDLLTRVRKEAVITVSAVDLSPAQKCLDNLFV